MADISILVVHSLRLFRETLRVLVDNEPGCCFAGETGLAAEIGRVAGAVQPDVAIIEASMPGPGILDATRQVLRVSPHTKVLFFSNFEDEDLLFECMQAGAAGFLSRETGATELMNAVRQVARGGKYLTAPSLSRFVDGWRGRRHDAGNLTPALTPREREILKLLAEGNSVKECAGAIHVSPKTVEAHKFNLMRKLDIHNKAQLVHYAYQKKIVRLQVA